MLVPIYLIKATTVFFFTGTGRGGCYSFLQNKNSGVGYKYSFKGNVIKEIHLSKLLLLNVTVISIFDN